MTKCVSGLCFASIVGFMLVGGSTGFGAHGRPSHVSTQPVASHPSKPKKAPKHSGDKPAHHDAAKSGAKPESDEAKKDGAAKHGDSKHAAGKSNEKAHEEHKPDGLASKSKAHEKLDEHHQDMRHDDIHHH